MIEEVSATANGVSVVSLHIEQDICRLAATCEAVLGSGNFTPGSGLVISIDGTTLFTGFVTEVLKSTDGTTTVRGMDKMSLTLDTFIVDEVRIKEEKDAGYWINYWLEYVGLESSGEVETGRTIPPTLPEERGWQYISVGDILLECLAYAGGYVLFTDALGAVQIVDMAAGMGAPTFTDLISYSRTLDNSWYRNRAVVFGTSSGSWDGDEYIPGDFTVVAEYPEEMPASPRTVAVSSSYIQNQSAAEDLARDLVDFFADYLDIRRYLIPGATAQIGGGVTSIETTVNDAGVRQLVTTGERCGFVWGHGRPYGQIMFAVPGTLSVEDDVAPWFVCDIPQGITLLNTIGAVKTPATGTYYELETSTDGITWTYIHANGIAAGYYLGSESDTFVDDFLPENMLLRLNVTGVGTGATDLTVAVRLKIGEV